MKVSLAVFITLVLLTTIVSSEKHKALVNKFRFRFPLELDLSAPKGKVTIETGHFFDTLIYRYPITDVLLANDLNDKL